MQVIALHAPEDRVIAVVAEDVIDAAVGVNHVGGDDAGDLAGVEIDFALVADERVIARSIQRGATLDVVAATSTEGDICIVSAGDLVIVAEAEAGGLDAIDGGDIGIEI